MNANLISLFLREESEISFLEFLNNSSFDELIRIDFREDRYKFIYNIEDKYEVPATEGSFSQFCAFSVQHLLNEEDSRAYAETMEPKTLERRLREAEQPGVLQVEFTARDLGGNWHWVNQIIVGAPVKGVPDGIAYAYIFDVQNIKNRKMGLTRVENKREKRDRLTGLRRENEFFKTAGILLENRSNNWKLMVMDLEEFKLFNEWYGRETGDKVLAQIGSELSREEEKHDGLAGYMGNDDFCLLVPDQRYEAEKLLKIIRNVIADYSVSVGFLPAIGVACANGSTSILNLYDQASLACQHAKDDFREPVRTFTPSMYRETEEDYRILSDFQEALKNREISFYLQPQCRARNGKIVGAEALVRWIKPDGTLIPPSAFVSVLEKYGFITDMDKYLWEEVCRWLRKCADSGLPQIPVSVNVSPVDIFTVDIPAHMHDLVGKYGLPEDTLKIEITESAYSGDATRVTETVKRLREMGFVVLMDDFGSGYSSLNMLHELNIDILKLDANFLHLDDTTETKGMHIMESVVNMAKIMGLPIIVEGVETKKQIDYLLDLGCRYVQGYYFYRPMPREQFEKLIADRANLETEGFRFIRNEQFHIREFLNDTVYTDSMLNSIIGPAAIYSVHGEEIDIVRYNQQFYHAVNVPDFLERIDGIQRMMPKKEIPLLHTTMEEARKDRLNGAGAVYTFYRTDGGYSRFLLHFFYLGEDGGAKRYYCSARDVTEITRLHEHMELLSRFTSHCVIFLIWMHGEFSFEVGANGMERDIGLSTKELEEELNSRAFFERVENHAEVFEKARAAVHSRENYASELRLKNARGEWVNIFVKADYVYDDTSDVKAILSIRRAEE
jgi:diguanylate cyclase (GGDEF) domain